MAGAARAAGVSVGLVQHYFANKQELLQATFSSVRADTLARVDAAIARAEQRGERIEHMLADNLLQLLPLDAVRREETLLGQAFAGLALEDERLAEHLRVAQHALRARVAQGLANGKECGEVEADADTEAEAHGLVALAEGLAARLLVSDTRAERRWARDAIRQQAARLCPGACGQHPRAR